MESNSGDTPVSPSAELPDDLATQLQEMDTATLQAVITYAQSLLPPTPSISEFLDEEAENVVDVLDHDGYTTVKKMEPCAEGCEDCPHGPYLYRVRVERSPADGSPYLHWDFLGRVTE